MAEFFPTKAKLKKLAERGIVPFSRLSTVSFSAAAVVVVLLLLMGDLRLAVSLSGEIISGYPHIEEARQQELIAGIRGAFFRLTLFPAGILLFVVLVWGLLQTRFHFRADAISFGANRGRQASGYETAAYVCFRMAAVITIAVVSAAVLFYLHFPRILSILNHGVADWLTLIPEAFRGALYSMAIIWGAIAIISLLVSRFAFMLINRMTYKELLEETGED